MLETPNSISNIHNIVNKISCSVFKSHIHDTKIKRLERAVYKGDISITDKIQIDRRKKPTMDSLAIYLRDQHKLPVKGNVILHLPKQPYGKHITYNHDNDFFESHFVPKTALETLKDNKELDELTRKFKLVNKRQVSSGKRIKRQAFNNDSCTCYAMKAGNLYCKKEKQVETIYNQDKEKYSRVKRRPHHKKKSSLIMHYKNKAFRTFHKTMSTTNELIDRLHPTGSLNIRDLSNKLIRKYSILFEKSSI